MKSIFTMGLTLFFALSLSAQSSFDAIFDEYEGDKGFTSVLITKRMFALFAQATDITVDDQSLDDIISDLNGIKILTYEGSDQSTKNAFEKKTRNTLVDENFEELMRVREEDQDVKIMVKEKDNIIHELILFVAEKKEIALISLSGIINLEKISKLSKSLNIKGLEHLEDVGE